MYIVHSTEATEPVPLKEMLIPSKPNDLVSMDFWQACSQVGARTGNARPGKFFASPNFINQIK